MGFECYRIGDLILNAGTQEVSRDGVAVSVPRLSFRLLLSLAQHAPNVVSTQQLEEEVWSGLVVDKGTVNKRALLLRKALGEDQGEGPYVTVIRGTGYRMLVDVERLDNCLEQPASENGSQQNWYQRSASNIRIASYWLLGFVALFVLYESIHDNYYVEGTPVVTEIGGTRQQRTPRVYSRNSVAVLPFINLSDGDINQYLGDGIAEEVINLLSGMDGLQVAARTSSFALRDTSLSMSEIAEKLNVGTILEGSIRHIEQQIRVTAQLVDSQSGYHIWSQNYERDYDEVFEVQDDIAVNIAQALKLTIDEGNQPDSRKATTSDIAAFSLYLKGRKLLNDRIQLRVEGLNEALGFFQKAVEKDPEFARAHAGIAAVFWLLTSYDQSLDRETYFERAEASANFALEIDPNSTDALSVLASIQSARGNLEQAVTLFQQIEAIGGSDSNTIHWRATLHLRLGYFDELIDELTEAYRLDPLNQHIGWSLASALNFAGKPREATEILNQLPDFAYRDCSLGLTAINAGRYADARELLRDARLRSGRLPAQYADLLIDALEDPSRSEEIAQRIVSAAGTAELEKLVSFEALLILGSARAFDLDIDPLEDIEKTQILAQVWNNWGVALRRDQRFKEWVKKLGYEDFWRKYKWPDRCRPSSLDDFECI